MQRLSMDDLELLQVLGTGTVGTVYRAILKETEREVAVKVLHHSVSSDDLVRARFRREMEILEKLNHPHIIHYYGGGEEDGQLFFAMELLESGNVREVLERYGALSWQEVASIGRQVCSALQHAHNQGIIHRDLKPGNLFLDTNANVKLGDFGIARDTHAADITSQGLTVGTYAYMSPEQITGETHITAKADLYSLGCVLFELLTGRKAFDGPNFAVVFEQHLRSRPPKVTELIPDCPPALSEVIDELLRKEPDSRPFNARAVQGVMNELLASDGLHSTGQPADQPAAPGHDVAAAAIVDLGQKSLERKLHPQERPQTSWNVLLVLGALVVALVVLAAMFGQ